MGGGGKNKVEKYQGGGKSGGIDSIIPLVPYKIVSQKYYLFKVQQEDSPILYPKKLTRNLKFGVSLFITQHEKYDGNIFVNQIHCSPKFSLTKYFDDQKFLLPPPQKKIKEKF